MVFVNFYFFKRNVLILLNLKQNLKIILCIVKKKRFVILLNVLIFYYNKMLKINEKKLLFNKKFKISSM